MALTFQRLIHPRLIYVVCYTVTDNRYSARQSQLGMLAIVVPAHYLRSNTCQPAIDHCVADRIISNDLQFTISNDLQFTYNLQFTSRPGLPRLRPMQALPPPPLQPPWPRRAAPAAAVRHAGAGPARRAPLAPAGLPTARGNSEKASFG